MRNYSQSTFEWQIFQNQNNFIEYTISMWAHESGFKFD